MLEDAIRRTCALYRDPTSWRRVQLNAMASDSSWRVSAGEYARLFRRLAARSAVQPANDLVVKTAKGSEPRSFAPSAGLATPPSEPKAPTAKRRAPLRKSAATPGTLKG
jgi:starch synthase